MSTSNLKALRLPELNQHHLPKKRIMSDVPATSFSVESLLGDLLSGKQLDFAVRPSNHVRTMSEQTSPFAGLLEEQAASSKSPDILARPPSRRPREEIVFGGSMQCSISSSDPPRMPPIYPSPSVPPTLRMSGNTASIMYSPFLPAFSPMIPHYIQNNMYNNIGFPYSSSGQYHPNTGQPTQLLDSTVISSCFTSFPPMKITVKRNIFKVPIQKEKHVQKQKKQKRSQTIQH